MCVRSVLSTPAAGPPRSASTARAADRALYMALVAARGARSGKRVSEATSLAIRRFGLKKTSSSSFLALRRVHGPTLLAPTETEKEPSNCTWTSGPAVVGTLPSVATVATAPIMPAPAWPGLSI